MKELPSSAVTMFRDLLERSQDAMFADAYPSSGFFTKKTIKGKPYWYFRETGSTSDLYVGPETDDLLQRIEKHKTQRLAHRASRSIVNMLKVAGLASPPPAVGAALSALQKAGIFRHRVALIGTHAFGAYGGLLGVRLPNAAVTTSDVDFAQFRDVSIAIAEDERLNFFDALKTADSSFRPIGKVLNESKIVSYVNDRGEKIEILSPRQGGESDEPVPLPSIGSHAQGLRYMDFLIRDLVPTVILHGAGIVVNVPTPERYAVHKLIVADKREKDSAKSRKDLSQASILFEAMRTYQKEDVLEAFREAAERGPAWREAIESSLSKIVVAEDLRADMVQIIRSAENVRSSPAP